MCGQDKHLKFLYLKKHFTDKMQTNPTEVFLCIRASAASFRVNSYVKYHT